MIGCWLLLAVRCITNYKFVIYIAFICIYFQRQKFPSMHLIEQNLAPEIRARYLELIYGASFWPVCHAPNVLSVITCVDCLQLKRSMIGWTCHQQRLAGLAWSMAVAVLTKLQSSTLHLQHLETCRLHWPCSSSSSMANQLTLEHRLNLMWTLQPILSPWMPATHCSAVIHDTVVHI